MQGKIEQYNEPKYIQGFLGPKPTPRLAGTRCDLRDWDGMLAKCAGQMCWSQWIRAAAGSFTWLPHGQKCSGVLAASLLAENMLCEQCASQYRTHAWSCSNSGHAAKCSAQCMCAYSICRPACICRCKPCKLKIPSLPTVHRKDLAPLSQCNHSTVHRPCITLAHQACVYVLSVTSPT